MIQKRGIEVKKKDILFVGRGTTENYKIDGGEYGARRVYRMVETAVGIDGIDKLIVKKPNVIQRIKNMTLFQSYGHSKELKNKIKSISSEDFEMIFFNGSIYGPYAKMLAKKGIKIMTFYHNIERNFYLDKFKASKSPIDLWMYVYISYNEHLATKYSDYLIALNERDSNELKRLYKRGANLISPTSYNCDVVEDNNNNIKNKGYLLFVGGNFFANVDGITSFIKEALPKLDMELWVVGTCCESLKKWVNEKEYPKVKLKGFVDDLATIYKGAGAVVCPIYSGSGMKTKTVEALKYGKIIFGTSESFEGVEGDYSKIGALCNTSEEFVKAINSWNWNEKPNYNEYSYSIFKNYYSDEIVFKQFKSFLESCGINLGE